MWDAFHADGALTLAGALTSQEFAVLIIGLILIIGLPKLASEGYGSRRLYILMLGCCVLWFIIGIPGFENVRLRLTGSWYRRFELIEELGSFLAFVVGVASLLAVIAYRKKAIATEPPKRDGP